MNNYDKSSTGINIEAYIYMSTSDSEMNFNQELKVLQYKDYRKDSILFYPGASEIDITEVKDLYKDSLNKLGYEEYYDQLMNELGHEDKLAFKAYLFENYYGNYLEALYEAACEMDGDVPNEYRQKDFPFREYGTHGYCQGDFTTIIIPKECEFEGITEHLDHLCWDAPLYCYIQINDKEFYKDDLISEDNYYESDVSTIKKDILKNIFYELSYPEFKEFKSFLDKNLKGDYLETE